MLVTDDQTAEAQYRQLTPRSRQLFERASRVMPGGTTRTSTYFSPYPLTIKRGKGSRVWDVDGREYFDLIGNYTAVALGHAHEVVVQAIVEQARKGTGFAANNVPQVELAEELCRRVPSLDMIRFCNSGTEATMFAMRLARFATGRSKIARVEGGYHGTHDFAEVSGHPPLELAGPADHPHAVADTGATPQAVVDSSVILPFNDVPAAVAIIDENADELAAVIVEPVLGSGAIPAEPAYLQALRAATRERGIVLIFDELITMRLSAGGAQAVYGVIPDLTTMGKVIGGGLPIGAFGGRRDLMALLDPGAGREYLPQGGTYNGNPLTAAAGLAALRALDDATFGHVNELGDRARAGLREVFASAGIAAQVTGIGPLFAVHLTETPVRDYRSLATRDLAATHRLFLGLLAEGVLTSPRGFCAMPVAAEEGDIDLLRGAVRSVLGKTGSKVTIDHAADYAGN
jgi:glutamate-1-semialdehyde 2,1-aminomutase